MKLIYLILKLRIDQKASLIKKILGYFNFKINTINFMVICFFNELLLAIGSTYLLGNFLKNNFVSWQFCFLAIIFLALVQGGGWVKKTHVFPFEELRTFSNFKLRKASNALFIASLLDQLCCSSFLFFFLILVTFCSAKNVKLALVIIFLEILVYYSLYFLSNYFWSSYLISKQIRKIGLVRLLTYLFGVISCFYLGKSLINYEFYPVFKYFSKNFTKINLLFDKNAINQFSENIKDYYVTFWGSFFNKLVNVINQQELTKISWCSVFLFGIAGLSWIYSPRNFLPINQKIIVKSRFDGCNIYLNFLFNLSKIFRKNNILWKNNLLEMKLKRWLFAKNFLSNIFFDLEAVWYIGIFSALIFLTHSSIFQAQILLLLNLYLLGVQSFSIRKELYSYFSISQEKEHFLLLNSTILGIKKSFQQKRIIFQMIFFSSTIILLLIDLLFFFTTTISFLSLLAVITITSVGFFVYPKIQMTLIPLVTNFNFTNETELGEASDENFLISRFQGFCRQFLNIVPLWLTISFVFVPQTWDNVIFWTEIFYLLLVMLILNNF